MSDHRILIPNPAARPARGPPGCANAVSTEKTNSRRRRHESARRYTEVAARNYPMCFKGQIVQLPLLPHIRDGGRAQKGRARSGHVHGSRAGTAGDAQAESGAGGTRSFRRRSSSYGGRAGRIETRLAHLIHDTSDFWLADVA